MNLLTDGGMTAPTWAFFSSIVVMLGGVIIELIRARIKSPNNDFAPQVIARLERIERRTERLEDYILENRKRRQ